MAVLGRTHIVHTLLLDAGKLFTLYRSLSTLLQSDHNSISFKKAQLLEGLICGS